MWKGLELMGLYFIKMEVEAVWRENAVFAHKGLPEDSALLHVLETRLHGESDHFMSEIWMQSLCNKHHCETYARESQAFNWWLPIGCLQFDTNDDILE